MRDVDFKPNNETIKQRFQRTVGGWKGLFFMIVTAWIVRGIFTGIKYLLY